MLAPGSFSAAVARSILSGDFQVLTNWLEGQLVPSATPQTSATVAVAYPGTGVAYTNNTAFVQQIIISGGTITVITLSAGGITGETTGTYILRPGDSVTCTSSVNPTVFNVTNLF